MLVSFLDQLELLHQLLMAAKLRVDPHLGQSLEDQKEEKQVERVSAQCVVFILRIAVYSDPEEKEDGLLLVMSRLSRCLILVWE